MPPCADPNALFRDLALPFRIRSKRRSPGGPGYPNQPADTPAAVAGIAADNVKAIDFVNNGETIPLEITNNAFFSNIATPPSAEPWTMQFRITYADGSVSTVDLPDPRQ